MSNEVSQESVSIKTARIPNEELVEEMRKKGVLFEGHYKLRNCKCSNVFIYPRRAHDLFGLRRQMLYVLRQIEYNSKVFLHVCLRDTTTKIIRSSIDMFRRPPKSTIFPDIVSGEMVFRSKDLKRLREQPFIIIDDVLREGVAMRKLIDVCIHHDLWPQAAITAFSAGTQEINGLRIEELVRFPIEQWHPGQCPMCQSGDVPYDPYHFHRNFLHPTKPRKA